MKYLPATILSLASLLLPLTTANFDLYWDQSSDGLNPPSDVGMSFFANDPDCDTVEDAYYWPKLGDVSGGKEGIRCKGDGCCRSCDPGEIEVLEMNFHHGDPVYHWTIYKDRNWRMYGLDGKVYGRCFPFPGKEYGKDGGGCGLTFGRREGNRAMRCLTRFTVDDFNAHLPN